MHQTRLAAVAASSLAAVTLALLPAAACPPGLLDRAQGDVHPDAEHGGPPMPAGVLSSELATLGALPGGQPSGSPDPAAEAEFLADHVQLTYFEDFTRAGEAYFDRTGRWIIFQATPQPAAGEEPTPHYEMYVARVLRDEYGRITGLDDHIQISEPGSANTCGWFHPHQPGVVLFGSTMTPPTAEARSGYSRDRSRYTWQFPEETEIVTRTVRAMVEDMVADPDERARLLARPDVDEAVPMFSRPGYDAEGSWSPDGRTVLYTNVDPETGDGDLFIHVVGTDEHRPIVVAEGYDGGPFFSPCGRWITYRSDRRGDNLLQVFVAELSFDADGLPDGIEREIQLTDDRNVNWAPYFARPNGNHLVYASSEVSHRNYEVFAIELDPHDPEPGPTMRMTHAQGFDGLPVFSFDGRWMMWTAQRGNDRTAEGRPSSQIWAARVVRPAF